MPPRKRRWRRCGSGRRTTLKKAAPSSRRRERRQLQQENLLLKRTLGTSHQFCNIIGRSDAMVAVFRLIETVASTTSTILVTGDSGTCLLYTSPSPRD